VIMNVIGDTGKSPPIIVLGTFCLYSIKARRQNGYQSAAGAPLNKCKLPLFPEAASTIASSHRYLYSI